MKTLMRRLIAAKSHSYGTRQLVAGDEYEASRVHSRVLVAARLATYAPESEAKREPGSVAQAIAERRMADAAGLSPADSQKLARLRHQARGLGVEVDLRWGVNRLNREIQQAGMRR